MTNQGSDPESPVGDGAAFDRDIDVLDAVIVLAKHKKKIILVPAASAILAFVLTFLFPNIYTGVARVMPLQESQSSAMALLGQLNALSGITGVSTGVKNPSDLYVGVLGSNTIADSLISRFSLQKLYSSWKLISFSEMTFIETREELASRRNVYAGTTDGIITIEVTDRDPKRAADIANGFVEELERLTRTLAITDGSRRRRFYEVQLVQAKVHLGRVEQDFLKTQQETGLIKLDGQGDAIIQAVAVLRAQISAKEVELGAMRLSLTERHPEYIRAQQQLAGFRVELSKLERAQSGVEAGILVPTGKVPEAGLEYLRKLREVKYHEAVFEAIAKQLEVARLDEAREVPMVQVLDRALPPDEKTHPKRVLIAIIVAVLIGGLMIAWAFAMESLQRLKEDPVRAGKVAALREHAQWDRVVSWFSRFRR